MEEKKMESLEQGSSPGLSFPYTRTASIPPEIPKPVPPAQLSVLVHEVVHHFQNVLKLKYECPQEREKLAYIAQDRWLGLFGHSLSDEFALDPFSLFVKTTCFY
jgi:hypothetical protein